MTIRALFERHGLTMEGPMSKPPSKPYLNAVRNVGAVLRAVDRDADGDDDVTRDVLDRIRSAVNVALGIEDEQTPIPGERYDVPIDDDSIDFEEMPGPLVFGEQPFVHYDMPVPRSIFGGDSIRIGPIRVSEEMRDMLMGVETIGEPESIATIERPHFERGQEMYVNGVRYVIDAVMAAGTAHEGYALLPDPKGQLAAKIEHELAMTRLTDTISDAAGRFTKGVSESVMAFYRSIELAVDDQAGHDQNTDQPEGAENGREG